MWICCSQKIRAPLAPTIYIYIYIAGARHTHTHTHTHISVCVFANWILLSTTLKLLKENQSIKILWYRDNATTPSVKVLWHCQDIKGLHFRNNTKHSCRFKMTVSGAMQHLHVNKLATIVEDDSKAPFSIATTPGCREGATPFPGLLHFTLDPYIIMLSVKQGASSTIFWVFGMTRLEIEPSLPGLWRTL